MAMSPGNDGLTKEFYICFSGEIAAPLVESLNCSFPVGQLSTSQRQAVITLIEKKGRDKRLVKNWRPISLMNVDTKIASKVLALRMKKVIPNLINYDQTAHVKGRSIGESIRIIDDMLYHADQENLDGILFAADLDKPLTLWNMVSSLLPLLNLGLVRIKYSGKELFFIMEAAVL